MATAEDLSFGFSFLCFEFEKHRINSIQNFEIFLAKQTDGSCFIAHKGKNNSFNLFLLQRSQENVKCERNSCCTALHLDFLQI